MAMELRLPQEKLRKLQEPLQEWQFKKTCTRHSLESLLGYLNHAYTCKVVRPGRSFIGRLIAMLTQAKRTHRSLIRINSEARSDIRWWHLFVSSWNGVSMLQEQLRKHPNHELWSDAFGSWAVDRPAVQLLQIQEVHPVAHSSACNFCRFLSIFLTCPI